MTAPKYASQAIDDMKEGTGLFDNVNARVTNIQFTKTPPDNYAADGNPIFSDVSFLIDGDGPEDDRKASQSYSLGASAGDNFTIGPDGYGLIPNSDDAVLRKDSKWGTFVSSLAKEGLPKAILQGGDFSKVIGLVGHFKRVADRERTFAESRNAKKSKFPPSTLVCTKILSLPGQSGAAGSAPAATTTAAPGTAVPSGDIDAKAGAYLAQVVKAKGGKVQRSQLTLLISTAAKADADKAAIAKRAGSEEFLNAMNEAGGVMDAAGEAVALVYDGASKPQTIAVAA